MPFLSDNVLGQGLDYLIANAANLHICSAEPTTYSQATTGGAVSLGSSAVTLTGPANAGSGTGQSATVPAISGATVSNTGTASHWAITDGTSELLATGALAASQGVTAANTFDLASFEIFVRDAVAA